MKRITILLILLTAIISSCQKFEPIIEDPNNPGQNGNKTLENAVIEDFFDWKTTKDIWINVTGNTNAVCKVKSTEGGTFLKVMLLADQTVVEKITMPTYQNELVLEYNGLTRQLPIQNGQITYEFN